MREREGALSARGAPRGFRSPLLVSLGRGKKDAAPSFRPVRKKEKKKRAT